LAGCGCNFVAMPAFQSSPVSRSSSNEAEANSSDRAVIAVIHRYSGPLAISHPGTPPVPRQRRRSSGSLRTNAGPRSASGRERYANARQRKELHGKPHFWDWNKLALGPCSLAPTPLVVFATVPPTTDHLPPCLTIHHSPSS
jgi:hypothetical protein